MAFSLEVIHSVDSQLTFGFYTLTEGCNTLHITVCETLMLSTNIYGLVMLD